MEDKDLQGNRINLPKIGLVKLVLHRLIPEGFKIKTAIITKKSDGWYISLSLEDTSIPELTVDVQPTIDNSIGIDVGLEKFLADSDGEFEEIPPYFRKSEERLAKLQQKVSARKKGSCARKLLNRKVAKLHQKVARQRKQFHFETAQKILNKADVVFVEDLARKPRRTKATRIRIHIQRAHERGSGLLCEENLAQREVGRHKLVDGVYHRLKPQLTRTGCHPLRQNPLQLIFIHV